MRSATNRDRAAIETLVFGALAEYGLKPDPSGTDCDLQDLERSGLESGGMFDVQTDDVLLQNSGDPFSRGVYVL